MNTYEIKLLRTIWTKKDLVKKVETYLNDVHKKGKQEIINVSFTANVAYVTLKKI